MPDGVNLSRRSLFRGRLSAPRPEVQLPWSVSWADFVADCTRCGDCLTACPEQILIKGDGGFPTVDFQRGECTFCGECVSACQVPVFRPTTQTPWTDVAHIEAGCLASAQALLPALSGQLRAAGHPFFSSAGASTHPQHPYRVVQWLWCLRGGLSGRQYQGGRPP